MVDQDATHDLGRYAKEVRAVFPVEAMLTDQAQVSFIDQRAGLQRVTGSLAAHIVPCQAMQLLVYQRDQLGLRLLVSFFQAAKKSGDGKGAVFLLTKFV